MKMKTQLYIFVSKSTVLVNTYGLISSCPMELGLYDMQCIRVSANDQNPRSGAHTIHDFIDIYFLANHISFWVSFW